MSIRRRTFLELGTSSPQDVYAGIRSMDVSDVITQTLSLNHAGPDGRTAWDAALE